MTRYNPYTGSDPTYSDDIGRELVRQAENPKSPFNVSLSATIEAEVAESTATAVPPLVTDALAKDPTVAAQFTTAGTGDELTAIQAWLNTPAPLGVKRLVGSASVSSTLTIPAGVYLDASAATITQTGTLRPTFWAKAGATLVGATIVGRGAVEWVNNSSVYAACGVQVTQDDTNVTIRNVTVRNMAGAGVYAPTAPRGLSVLDCHFAGVGSPTIPATTGQFGGGIVVNNNGTTNLTVRGGSITGFAQGINTGTLAGFYIGGGLHIHDIPGQHALYLGSVSDGTISGVFIDGIQLEGIKAQVSDASAADGAGVTIGDITMRNVGSHGVHLANTQTTKGANRLRRVVIHDVTVHHTTAGGGDDINLEYVNNVTVHDCHGTGGARGISALGCAGLNLHHNRHAAFTQSGITLTDVTDSDIDHNRLTDGATTNNVNSEFGIMTQGATTADLRFTGNKITDAAGNTKYAVYVAAGDLTTMSFINNRASGMTDYGFRSAVTTSTALWVGNDLAGALGRFANVPTNAGAIADTTGATLTALEAEVNKLKARMRQTFTVN